MDIDKTTRKKILQYQKNEITEYHIYKKLAGRAKDTENKKILGRIAEDELRHYHVWKKYTGADSKPDRFKIWAYYTISRFMGLSFGLKLMEKGEENAQEIYKNLGVNSAEIEGIIKEEEKHEAEALKMLDEDFLRYTSSMVLGLNDALVELTGALAGFTLALKNSQLIALVGLVTGIAASMSMASSEYLSTKAEEGVKNPLKASIYTGIAYILTVLTLICPYLIFENYFACLAITLTEAVLIIFLFNYYISITRELPFVKQFLEMAGLSLGIALLSFLIGHLLRAFLGVDI
jgi:VIT1/CCC1 family predicted Fe2+/Mn2+ transporter